MTIRRRPFLTLSLLITCAPIIVTAQDLRALARDQALQRPGEPLLLPAPPADYVPMSAEQLAKNSALVVEARLVRLKSYLGGSNDRVLTDYSLVLTHLIAGTLPAQTVPKPGGPTPQLRLTVYGGEISLDGVAVRAIDNNREPIDERATYLLFLRKSRQAGSGRYEIYDGAIFEVRENQIRPLAKQTGDAFKWSVGLSRDEVLATVRRAVSRH